MNIKVNFSHTHYLSNVGPGADPGVQAVSLQVTLSHPPGGRLPLLSIPRWSFSVEFMMKRYYDPGRPRHATHRPIPTCRLRLFVALCNKTPPTLQTDGQTDGRTHVMLVALCRANKWRRRRNGSVSSDAKRAFVHTDETAGC